MAPVHISHVLVSVAMHHICSTWRPSTLGQQSAANLATIKYLNIYFFLVFQNKLPKIYNVACESRQFGNPDFFILFNNSKNLRPSHGRSHGVTDVMNQHQGVCPALEPLRQ